MSRKTKSQEEKDMIAQTPQRLSEDDRLELEELHRIALSFSIVAGQIAGNTALVPNGQEVAKQFEAIARLMENLKSQWLSQKIASMGYPNAGMINISIKTGEIIPVEDEPESTEQV
jgi:hypothetical protein